jgi:DNA-damage-inducible protein D
MKHEIISFEESKIRKVWHDEQWYFSVIDIIGILTESADPKRYWSVLKVRENQLTTVCSRLKLTATDGKLRVTDCANTEGVFRIITINN